MKQQKSKWFMNNDTKQAFEAANFPDGYRLTPLGPLPEEWRVVRFEEAISQKKVRVGKLQQAEYRPCGKYPIVDQSRNYIAGYTDREDLIYQGDLPVIIFGDHTRVWKFVDFSFVCGADGTKLILPNVKIFDALFLFFAFQHLDIPSRGYNRHYALLREKSIPLPPLPEQRAIAHVLRAVQRAREATERVIAATRELKKSLMRHLFTYGPVPVGATHASPLQDTDIGPIPAHWRVVRLGEVVDIGPTRFERHSRDVLPFIPMSLIPEQGLFISQWEYRTPQEIRSGVAINEGDLLLAKITPCLENGKQGIVRGIPGGWGYATTEVFPIRTGDQLLTEILALYLLQPHVRQTLATKMEGTTGRQRLPKSVLLDLFIPLPPLSEQREIARILQAVDRKLEADEARRQALEALFKTLLHDLMTARRRLPADFVAQFAAGAHGLAPQPTNATHGG